MILPQIKEREYRFRLALRMGLPIFALIFILISSTLISTHESLEPTFYFISILLLVFSIYFIFFLIYRGFDERITDTVSKTFTRDYLYKFLRVKIKKEYTLMLLSIDNLNDINVRYGLQNGDKVLLDTVEYISAYLINKGINNFPIGHIKGGDFILGLSGKKEEYSTILELLCLKSSEYKIDEIEINISGAITDTNYSNDLEHMIENLFEIQEENKNKRILNKKTYINPNDLESYVIQAIKTESVEIMFQNIYEDETIIMEEYFPKLKSIDGKTLHPKSYMKVLNKLGLAGQYDYLVLKKSVDLFFKNKNKMFSININATSLRNHKFLENVEKLLENNSELRDKIVFIVSEKEYYSHISRFNTTLQTLRKNGIKICLDKLGSIHTTFLYLRDLDVDMVRFDSLYTRDEDSKKYRNIVDGFNTMAQNKGLKTWLKMINSTQLKDLAKEIGINYTQGKELAKLNEEKR